jgi:hypothetical protein
LGYKKKSNQNRPVLFDFIDLSELKIYFFKKIIIKNYVILIHYNQPDQQATYALS